ncbi:MAG: hypothetical protein CL949_13785 [Erythrobacter sp.]|nr:hypothetical protein [Erythrobacter sp.]
MELNFALDENDDWIWARNARKIKRYTCPGCRERVRPVQGDVRVHHFRHLAGSECNYSGMSEHHLKAQTILAERKLLPDLLNWGKLIELDYVECEVVFDDLDIRVDLYGEFEEGQHEGYRTGRIMVEVKHTSACSEQKIGAAARAGYLLFEVDVSGFDVTDTRVFTRQLYDRANWKQLLPKGQRSLHLQGGSAKQGSPFAFAKGVKFAHCRKKELADNRQLSLPFAQAALHGLAEGLLRLWLNLVWSLTFFIHLFRRVRRE